MMTLPYSAADARTGGSGNLATLVLIGRRTLHLVESGIYRQERERRKRGEREGGRGGERTEKGKRERTR